MRCSVLCLVLLSASIQGAFTASRRRTRTCTSPSDCSSSEGCVSGTCEDSCTWDSQCKELHTKRLNYYCNTSASAGVGACTYRPCNTDQQCKDWYGRRLSSTYWTCHENDCVITIAGDETGCKCKSITNNCTDDYYVNFVVVSIAGVVIALVFIVATGIPCCCGKDFDKPICPKVVGGIAIAVGILCCFIPLMAAAGAADGAIDDVCNECTWGTKTDGGCTDEERQSIRDFLVLVAYTSGYGWLACITGITASVMGFCTLRPCCGPLEVKKNAVEAIVVQGTVAGNCGTPAGDNNFCQTEYP